MGLDRLLPPRGARPRRSKERESSHLEAVTDGRLVRFGLLNEGAMRRPPRASVGHRVVDLEEQSLVRAYSGKPVPAMCLIVRHGIALSFPFGIVPLQRDELGALHGPRVGDRERERLNDVANRPPDLDDGEASLEELVGFVGQEVADGLSRRLIREVAMDSHDGLTNVRHSVTDGRRAPGRVEDDHSPGAGLALHESLDCRAMTRLLLGRPHDAYLGQRVPDEAKTFAVEREVRCHPPGVVDGHPSRVKRAVALRLRPTGSFAVDGRRPRARMEIVKGRCDGSAETAGPPIVSHALDGKRSTPARHRGSLDSPGAFAIGVPRGFEGRRAAQVLAESQEVDRTSAIEPDVFWARYHTANVPLLLEGFAAGWPAVGRWSPRYFGERFGDVAVGVAEDVSSGTFGGAGPYRRWRNLPVRELAELMERETEATAYLVAQSQALRSPCFATLSADVVLDPRLFAGDLQSEAVSLWMGPRHTVTPLHCDTKNSLLVQIYGTKRVKLVSPLHSHRVYNEYGGYSQVDPEVHDLRRWPLFAGVPVQTVTIEPGDALFLPIGWWHHVRSLSASISLSLGHFVCAESSTGIVASRPDERNARE
jgi:hypothetical protein